MTHGGDIYTHRGALDFSANVNPLGLPEGVRLAMLDCADLLCAYPDPQCREVRGALSDANNMPAEYITCGNGAADIIFALCQGLKPKNALLLAPTFSEYEQALASAGCEIRYHELRREDGFEADKGLIEGITPDIDIVFLCNPNNPTGCVMPRELMRSAIARCAEVGAVLVADECFVDFLDDRSVSVLDCVRECGNLVVLKAFTKLYAMAGIRLGYCACSNPEINAAIEGARQPWSVSTIAQLCGVAALKQTEYVQKTRELICRERAFLKSEIAKRARVYGSNANYVFFEGELGLKQKLLGEGILIRSCANYHGLGETFYRVAVRNSEENKALIAALDRVCNV